MTAEQAEAMIEYVIATPRQPEEDAASILLPALRQYMHNDGSGLLAGYEYERTQQIVAELRDRLDVMTQCADNYSRMFEESAEECEHLKDCQENDMLHIAGLVAERDTLRQQLAERDAEILEQCRLNGMGAERELKLMAQRDRLAGILESVAREHELIRQMKNCEVHRGRGSFGIAVMSDIYAIEWQALDKELQELIDTRRAALAEVKPRP